MACICASVTSRCSVKMAEQIQLFWAQRLLSTYPTLLCNGISVSKNKGTALRNFVPQSERRWFFCSFFHLGTSIV